MHLRLSLVVMSISLLLSHLPVNARQPLAAVVQITYDGVQLQRANTADWLSLPVGAQAPFGAGDTLRSDKSGRALITFSGAAVSLLLPGTEYRLVALDQTDDQKLNIELTLSKGRSIQQILDTSALGDYKLHLEYMTVEQPTALFATQARTDTGSDVIVADGTLKVTQNAASLDLPAGTGLRAKDSFGEITPISAPQGFSFLSVTSKTCRAVVNSTIPGEISVSTRLGPGEDYLNLGNIPNGTIIAIVGQTENGTRYLTPFLSNYGWLIANGIITQSCDTIPVVPAVAQPVNGVINPADFELTLLIPFFGTRAQNVEFYLYQ